MEMFLPKKMPRQEKVSCSSKPQVSSKEGRHVKIKKPLKVIVVM